MDKIIKFIIPIDVYILEISRRTGVPFSSFCEWNFGGLRPFMETFQSPFNAWKLSNLLLLLAKHLSAPAYTSKNANTDSMHQVEEPSLLYCTHIFVEDFVMD